MNTATAATASISTVARRASARADGRLRIEPHQAHPHPRQGHCYPRPDDESRGDRNEPARKRGHDGDHPDNEDRYQRKQVAARIEWVVRGSKEVPVRNEVHEQDHRRARDHEQRGRVPPLVNGAPSGDRERVERDEQGDQRHLEKVDGGGRESDLERRVLAEEAPDEYLAEAVVLHPDRGLHEAEFRQVELPYVRDELTHAELLLPK